jgi:hypothetical protein
MAKVIHTLPKWARREFKSIFCDSKCGSDYLVVLHRWDEDNAWLVGQFLRVALRAINGGFNGLYVRNQGEGMFGGDKEVYAGGGEWIFDEEECEEIQTDAGAGAVEWEKARRIKVDGWLNQPAGYYTVTTYKKLPGNRDPEPA